jgi:hypothetical protein
LLWTCSEAEFHSKKPVAEQNFCLMAAAHSETGKDQEERHAPDDLLSPTRPQLLKCPSALQITLWGAFHKTVPARAWGPGSPLDSCLQDHIQNLKNQEPGIKIICSPSYADIRSRANITRGLDFDHMIKQEHTRKV